MTKNAVGSLPATKFLFQIGDERHISFLFLVLRIYFCSLEEPQGSGFKALRKVSPVKSWNVGRFALDRYTIINNSNIELNGIHWQGKTKEVKFNYFNIKTAIVSRTGPPEFTVAFKSWRMWWIAQLPRVNTSLCQLTNSINSINSWEPLDLLCLRYDKQNGRLCSRK